MEDAGGGHVANCATDIRLCPNRARFALTVSESAVWETGCVTVRTQPSTCPAWRRRRAGRSASISMCRSARRAADTATSTPTRPPNWAARTPTAGWRPCAPSWRSRVAGPVGRLTGRSTRCSSAAGRRRCSAATGLAAVLDAVREHFMLARGRRGDDGGESGVHVAAVVRAAARGRVHAGVARHAVGRPARAGGAGPGALAGPGARRGARSPRRRVRPRQPRPHLWHAGGVRRRPAAAPSTPRSRQASTMCPATRWSSRTGTALARRVRRGEIAPPDNDVLAQRYELLDARLSAAGFDWYEVSNWSRPGGECRHNIGYWNGGEWWGAGPGAHGYVGATRWWNVKHPNAYAQALGRRAAAGRRFRAARRRDAAHRGRDAAAAAARRAAAGRAERWRTGPRRNRDR